MTLHLKTKLAPALLAAPGAALAAVGPAAAAGLTVKVEIPRLQVAEYHRPYLAVWLESPTAGQSRTLALWYEAKNREDGGRKWLADLRQWWRKAGRGLTVPADGITGATRAPGPQTVTVTPAVLSQIPAGQYQLVVEAAREVGGHEAVRMPLSWPPKAKTAGAGKGATELGAVSFTATP